MSESVKEGGGGGAKALRLSGEIRGERERERERERAVFIRTIKTSFEHLTGVRQGEWSGWGSRGNEVRPLFQHRAGDIH